MVARYCEWMNWSEYLLYRGRLRRVIDVTSPKLTAEEVREAIGLPKLTSEEVLQAWGFKSESTEKNSDTVLDEAKALIYGDREADYGHPKENLAAIAWLWSAYISAKRVAIEEPEDFSEADVAIMLLLLKIARLRTGRITRDTVVDMAGYAGLLARVTDIDG